MVRRVSVLGAGTHVEIEIDASQPITPQTLVVPNPDRLVVDFPGAIPGNELHAIKINRAQVKGVRVGLFSAKPPVTRIVVDLSSPQGFQIFPSGRTVIVKMGGLPGTSALAATSPVPVAHAHPAPPAPPQPQIDVEFQNGNLTIQADKVTMAQVLREIQRRTGAQITIPPAAEQEQVIADYGPGPASKVLAALLNGSPFDFVLVGSAQNPQQITSILLTPRGSGPAGDSQFYPAVTNPPADANNQPEAVQDAPDNQTGPDIQQPPQ